MTKITALENFHRMMEGRHPERLPFNLSVTEPVEELIRQRTGKGSEETFDPDYRVIWINPGDSPERWRTALESLGYVFPPNSEIGSYGGTWIRPPVETLGKATHLKQMVHPFEVVEDVSQLESLPWPDESDLTPFANLPAQAAQIHDAGKVAVGGLEMTLFESSWYLRGMDNLFCDLAEENGIADWLLDYFTKRSMAYGSAFAAAGFDCITLGDDVGTQQRLLLSVDSWRQHLKPRLKRVIDAIRAASPRKVWIQYHSDGNVNDLVEDFIEVGIDILNPVQPECMNAADLAARVGNRLAMCGMIGTQTTMPFGTPDDVRKVVAEIAELHSKGARLVAAPTHVLEPDVPWENIVAFVDAIHATKL